MRTDAEQAAFMPLTDALKEAIRRHYAEECQYCGVSGARHVEHIIPKSAGGPDTLGNTTLGCQRCNLRKGAIELDPMFVAIAHARAKHAAPRILRLVEQRVRFAKQAPPPLQVQPKTKREPQRFDISKLLYGDIWSAVGPDIVCDAVGKASANPEAREFTTECGGFVVSLCANPISPGLPKGDSIFANLCWFFSQHDCEAVMPASSNDDVLRLLFRVFAWREGETNSCAGSVIESALPSADGERIIISPNPLFSRGVKALQLPAWKDAA